MALPDEFRLKWPAGDWSDLTITLASLASDASLIAGRESTAVSNLTTLFDAIRVAGKVTTGTSPTVDKSIEVWAYGEGLDNDAYPDAITGSDANALITSADIKNAAIALAAVINTDATSDRTYPWETGDLAALFGGLIPPKWGIFVVHDTGVNLKSDNQQISYQGSYRQIVD